MPENKVGTGYYFSYKNILSPINPGYEKLILSDFQRFAQIFLKFKTNKIWVDLRKSEKISGCLLG